ncbi:YicC/YloC family endoribonuclease [Aquisphaera giovannonii]|nr:YicC/YloC family endoribonuclease [Aquisphaera giovannonii]
MTGFGDARHQDPAWSIEVEVRTVNNRHLKLSTRISDPYAALEADLEHLVRQRIRRGAVQLSLRVDRPRRAEDYRLNLVALASYRDQLRAFGREGQGAGGAPGDGPGVALRDLLALPGVVEEAKGGACDPQQDWPAISRVVGEALDKLEAARAKEGRAMADELQAMGRAAEALLGRVADRGPLVVQSYQGRLTERIGALVRDHGVSIDAKDLIREVAILADRSDISEEIIRLRAHLSQFQEILRDSESAGRKLEFVVQEMGREANTIGSKANDVEISRHVFEIKGLLERIRELIQNVE